MAPATDGARDPHRIHRRFRIVRRQNDVLAMAVGAHRSVFCSLGDRLPVHALPINLGNSAVARAARRRHVPVIYFRARVASRVNFMASVTVRTGSRILFARRDRTTMNARLVGFDRVREGDLVAGEERGVGMARSARIREIPFRYRRLGVLRGE